jgi:hypothetical protein
MKEYRFPKQNNIICYGSLIIATGLIIIGLLNWIDGIWFIIPFLTFWIPIFVYLSYKNGTGVIKYDENYFEIKSDVLGGSNVKTDWTNLKEITIQLRFSNIILNFGKHGFAVFRTDRLEFKLFTLEMLNLLLMKKELSEITNKIAFVKDINPTTFNETDKKIKKQEIKKGLLQIVHVIITLVLMFTIVMGTVEIFKHYDLYSKYKLMQLFAPIIVFPSLWVANKLVSACFSIYFNYKQKNTINEEKETGKKEWGAEKNKSASVNDRITGQSHNVKVKH